MIDQDRSGIPDAEMAVTEGDEASPLPDPNSPATEPAGEAETHSDPAAALQAEPELPQKFQPPEGGDPFALRVDGTEIPIEGARVIDGHIFMPRDVWDRHIQPKYVANRDAWRTKEQQFQQRIRALETAVPEEREAARAQLALIGEMLDGTDAGREKLIKWLEGYEQNAPMLKVQAELRMERERLAKYEAEKAEAETARQAEELRPRLQAHVAEQVKEAAKLHPQLKGQKDLAEWVWKFHAGNLFYEDHNGRVQFRDDLFRDLMEDQARRVQVVEQKTTQVAQVAAKNAKAVGPARTPEGKFTKPTPAPAKKKMTAEEWEEWFNAS